MQTTKKSIPTRRIKMTVEVEMDYSSDKELLLYGQDNSELEDPLPGIKRYEFVQNYEQVDAHGLGTSEEVKAVVIETDDIRIIQDSPEDLEYDRMVFESREDSFEDEDDLRSYVQNAGSPETDIIKHFWRNANPPLEPGA